MSEIKEKCEFTDETYDFVCELMNKADVVNEKTSGHSNMVVNFPTSPVYVPVPVRLDDFKLWYIGCRLLPNIANYLINILPQLFYPYVVAYVQNLSEFEDHDVTINELFDIIFDLDSDTENGNILNSSKTSQD